MAAHILHNYLLSEMTDRGNEEPEAYQFYRSLKDSMNSIFEVEITDSKAAPPNFWIEGWRS
jgi:hypothetical protein